MAAFQDRGIIWSDIAGNVPTPDEMSRDGRIGINQRDGKLFTRRPDGTVRTTPLNFDLVGGLPSAVLPLSVEAGAGAENSAILNAFFADGGQASIGDPSHASAVYEFDDPLIIKSGATFLAVGNPILRYTGTGGTAVSNASTAILTDFKWLGVGLD
ncbi:MAG: hypothetical protein JWR61_5867, partial [Ferruginibacter sp.]|uniref:hypothetical protein n=1 Tax=Ferruginibacter sp. TaxID=1940288 RepID=UPI00265AE51A